MSDKPVVTHENMNPLVVLEKIRKLIKIEKAHHLKNLKPKTDAYDQIVIELEKGGWLF